MRYAFYISGSSGRLFKFLKQAKKEDKKSIKLVISDYKVSEELKDVLEEEDIYYIIIEYSRLGGITNREKNHNLSNIIKDTFDKFEIDYCFSFGSHLLCGELLKKYQNRIINFHPSILPLFPGIKAIDQAVEKGNIFLAGNTAHFIDNGMDTGMIIMQSVIPLNIFLDTNDYDVILDMQIEMLNQLFAILNKNRLQIINGRVIIIGADYSTGKIFPCLDKSNKRFKR